MTEAVIAMPGRPRGLARLSQFIDYLFWLLYSLLAIRLILVFFSASSWAGFVRFIDALTNPFYAPFRGIVASQPVGDGFTLAVPILIAIVVYALLHLAINKLLWLFAYRRTAV
jgi:uncharacterized protein YggT (Ycf19 family)